MFGLDPDLSPMDCPTWSKGYCGRAARMPGKYSSADLMTKGNAQLYNSAFLLPFHEDDWLKNWNGREMLERGNSRNSERISICIKCELKL